MKTVKEFLNEKNVPVVAIDEKGIFYYVNDAFENAFGWKREDLIGNLITLIMPSHMRDAHNFGFSRFLTTELPRILGKPLSLPTLCKDGSTLTSEHFIIGEKKNDKWEFAATIKPLKE